MQGAEGREGTPAGVVVGARVAVQSCRVPGLVRLPVAGVLSIGLGHASCMASATENPVGPNGDLSGVVAGAVWGPHHVAHYTSHTVAMGGCSGDRSMNLVTSRVTAPALAFIKP